MNRDELSNLEYLEILGAEIAEMIADADIDVYHARRSTIDERLAYVAELVARGSDHSLNMARRELRLITIPGTTTIDLKRRVLERPKRPSQILPPHYKQPR